MRWVTLPGSKTAWLRPCGHTDSGLGRAGTKQQYLQLLAWCYRQTWELIQSDRSVGFFLSLPFLNLMLSLMMLRTFPVYYLGVKTWGRSVRPLGTGCLKTGGGQLQAPTQDASMLARGSHHGRAGRKRNTAATCTWCLASQPSRMIL